jgi:hypothetical protein
MPFLVIATIGSREAWCEVTPQQKDYPFYQSHLWEMNGQTYIRHVDGKYSQVVGNITHPVMDIPTVYILTGVLDSAEVEEEEPGFHRVFPPYISQTAPVVVVKFTVISD